MGTSVSGVSHTTGTTSTPTTQTASSALAEQLGAEEFLQLLITQLRYQDPLEPVDDRDFLAQLAQFTALEAITEQTRWAQMSYGLGLVGCEVTYRTDDGQILTGVVQALRISNGTPLLSLGDREIGLDQVISATSSQQAVEEESK